MGREIRMVPPEWEHPRYTASNAPNSAKIGKYRPLYDETFKDASIEWKNGFAEWEAKTHESYTDGFEYWEYWSSPPESEYYRPPFESEPTWYQVYETVSEGTPVTPPFETKAQLIMYLVDYGDFWHQENERSGRNSSKPTYDQAKNFVEIGSASAMTIVNQDVSGSYGQKM